MKSIKTWCKDNVFHSFSVHLHPKMNNRWQLLRPMMNNRGPIIVLLSLFFALCSIEQADAQPCDERDTLAAVAELPEHTLEALLSDAHDIYRICNSRPGRLIQAHGQQTGKMHGASGKGQATKQTITLNHPDGVRRQPSAPLRCCAPCDYFIFALRRILC